MPQAKNVKICRCGHPRSLHGNHRGRSDCSRCVCLTHPSLGSEIYEIRACLLYPENCRGICWAFKDKRKKRTRIFNFFLGR